MVNVISIIAMIGVFVCTTAMVVALSIFNGLDVLIKQYFSVFDSEIKITAVEGKYFDPTTSAFDSVRNHPSVLHYSEVVEEIALLRYDERQFIAQIKGVDSIYFTMTQLDSFLYDGNMVLNDGNFNYTVVGRGVAYNLGASTNFIKPINISIPKRGNSRNILSNPFQSKNLYLSGIYEVGQVEVDDQYALVTLDLARDLLDLSNEVTSVELKLKPGTKVATVQNQLSRTLGNTYRIQNRYQQHETYYNVAKSERFFLFLILSFILIIASFNLAGAITMLILDKKKDIHILQGLGLTRKRIGHIFLLEGMLVTTTGAIAGIAAGLLICLGQIHFGWLKFPSSFAIEAYPVEIRTPGLFLIFFTVLIIGIGASWLPVKLLPKRFFEISQY